MREKRCGYILQIKYKKIKHLIPLPLADDFMITGLVDHSAFVEKDMLFVVRKGKNYDGFQDVEVALKKQAIILHQQEEYPFGYYVEKLDEVMSALLDILYTDVHYPFKLIGVCGSNGKSSVVSCLYQALKEYPCMRIGTHFIETRNHHYTSNNTTPNCMMLMHSMELAKKEGVQYVIMEVSSHAIDQKRIHYLRFDYIIYTNIARDHLDYHQTLLHYRYTKYKLMHYLKEQGMVIVNRDELYYGELKKLNHHTLITYGTQAAHFQISDVQLSLSSTTFYLNRFYFKMSLLSMFNVYNVSAIIALLRLLNFSYYTIYKMILTLHAKEGRMQLIYEKQIKIYIDYAHTAKAMYESLRFFKQYATHRFIVVVGCGGNREKEKREEIGYYASYFADICIFSEDNSREEDIQSIFHDMKKRVEKEVYCIENRKDALQYAVNIAQKNDIILVSGKGNEKTLDKKGKVIHFDDQEVLLAIVGEKVWK
ncbi:MAG: UDP-N-acetylmuramoyl-L-alanyl-D-glutamate--2,6-diaminopimelate ligase [Erysipelotrichia bacterium]|nr:UDP-N-acetylmuramoyl-L-alanyl-D-glutamate--2,6-diaminopimelate ligase [Erysipelotrichia bacterium]NCC54665.1 UDP-N-acetylmuramoyl-L-alanyl-D-glutamate--2,6-diaminopimelate ligase [Erysipelotrichia bacterium]